MTGAAVLGRLPDYFYKRDFVITASGLFDTSIVFRKSHGIKTSKNIHIQRNRLSKVYDPSIDGCRCSSVNDALKKHLKFLICDEQHGFTPGRSTTTNLLCYKDYISSALDDRAQVHSVYADFQKAFDTVPHQLLLHKMCNQFGVGGSDLDWFQSYLTNRFQRVVVNGGQSDWVPVTSGVPQGSILGPSLFLMYMNDITSCFHQCECLLFADDVKIFRRIYSVSDCIDFQHDLTSFSCWCAKWLMKLNLQKCFFINFSLKRSLDITFDYVLSDSILHSVTEIKDLGVIFSSTLSFTSHVNMITKKAYRMLGFIKRIMKSTNNVSVFKTLYNAHIRSHVDYCSPVWSSDFKCVIAKIESIQKRFVKHLCFISNTPYCSDNYVELCRNFNLPTLEGRRKITDFVLFRKIARGEVNCPYLISSVCYKVPLRRTRHTELFTSKKKNRLLLRKSDFLPRICTLANSTSSFDILTCSNFIIKKHLMFL